MINPTLICNCHDQPDFDLHMSWSTRHWSAIVTINPTLICNCHDQPDFNLQLSRSTRLWSAIVTINPTLVLIHDRLHIRWNSSHFVRFKQFQSSVAVHKHFISRVIDYNFFNTLPVIMVLHFGAYPKHVFNRVLAVSFICRLICLQYFKRISILYFHRSSIQLYTVNGPHIFKNVDSINSILCFWIIVTLLSLYYLFWCNQCNMYDLNFIE